MNVESPWVKAARAGRLPAKELSANTSPLPHGYRDYASWPDPVGRARGDYDADPESKPQQTRVLVPARRPDHFGNLVCAECGYHDRRHSDDCSWPMVPADA